MDFEKHLFISYAHIDNTPMTPDDEGWITQFHESLDAFLSMRLGEKARIWRDERLQGNDDFAQEIVDQFPKTALLASILTPRYVKSDWCTREVTEFCDAAEKTVGVSIDNKHRVFKVIKTPVSFETPLPPVLETALGYEFFTNEEGAPLELDPEESPQDYKRKINKLAWDITNLLKALEAVESGNGAAAVEQAEEKPTIYLAECSYDLKREREILECELKHHGYSILPDHEMPRDEEGYISKVRGLMENSALSIHLVGGAYGAVPDGETIKSAPMLQNELAVDRSKAGKFSRLIWLPESTEGKQPQQQEFIDALHQESEAQYGADLITGDIEELKTAIHATLEKLQRPKPELVQEEVATGEGPKLIYVICDERDRKATVPLRKYLRAQDYEAKLPVFEGDATEIREAHQRLLTQCDGLILYYGAGDEAWRRTIENDLKKMAGFRADKPLLARFTYLGTPKTEDKEDLIDMEESNLIVGFDDFSEAGMAEFLQAVDPSRATS